MGFLDIAQDKFNALAKDIRRLKEERKAVILAHYYQRPEIQEVADFIGDSLQLSQQAANTEAEVIVFCGVHFMAETAAILSPDKEVLLPEHRAGCPMADMVTADSLRARKAELPDAVVVTYVNSSAEVKAESDICCTSSNAVKIIQSIPADKRILFVPDRNLGDYVAKETGRDLILWEGYCNTHDRVTVEDLIKARERHPGALVLVHPECRPEVVAMADFVGSTSGILKYARNSEGQSFIIGTEKGILHQLRKHCPEKEFFLASESLVCPNMKATTLDKVRWALEDMQPKITVDETTRVRALKAVERMLAVS